MSVQKVYHIDASIKSGWYINIMLNRTDGNKGSGATKQLKHDEFYGTYHNELKILQLLKELCKKEKMMNCYNDVMEMI
eukprot:4274820-Ditylum_brightwellii.AAC.1